MNELIVFCTCGHTREAHDLDGCIVCAAIPRPCDRFTPATTRPAPAFELGQAVTHRIFGNGVVRGYRNHNEQELFITDFGTFSARIPAQDLRAG